MFHFDENNKKLSEYLHKTVCKLVTGRYYLLNYFFKNKINLIKSNMY